MAETVVPPSQAVERPARRRWDPLSPASRIWIAFALALLLICTTGFSMPLVFGIEDNDPRRDEFATVLGEAVGNVVFVVYLVLTLLYFWREKPDRIRARAEARYGRPRRRLRRLLPFARILLVVMVAWGAVTAAAIDLPEAQAIAPHETGLLTVFATGDVILSWFILHSVYAEHYAVLYYHNGGGLDFAGETAPDYLDFAYFAYSIGMTFGTTDVDVTSRTFRRTMLPHKLFSFAFNTAILALVFTVLFQ